MTRYLLFLHGFQGSSQSFKRECIAQYLSETDSKIELISPQLACYPKPAWSQICEIMQSFKGEIIGVVGSSLGGLFAARASLDYDLPAVLVNPVADLSMVPMLLGEHIHPYTQERFRLCQHHLDELVKLRASPDETSMKQWLMLQKGDEVLDYQKALKAYPNTKQTIESGGEHGFAGFKRYVPAIMRFFMTYEKLDNHD
ncbi:YqiA/YcfP family alpha/beta fold hydrolase [Celerinatantimonas sp. MCCC 1A17872]|uniref:YqiA/YcfP family alpha/beta fold hydrolase n=1 Tax=Celerinatantimonas sp. MCCC 1A17872 TaxID=3177514 RepID=UPI0038BE3A47